MITPTIGRKVWFWPVGEPAMHVNNPNVPLDATVIYPWGDGVVNLRVTDHAGNTFTKTSVTLHQGSVDSRPASSCATWMPYQMGQAASSTGRGDAPGTDAPSSDAKADPGPTATTQARGDA